MDKQISKEHFEWRSKKRRVLGIFWAQIWIQFGKILLSVREGGMHGWGLDENSARYDSAPLWLK